MESTTVSAANAKTDAALAAKTALPAPEKPAPATKPAPRTPATRKPAPAAKKPAPARAPKPAPTAKPSGPTATDVAAARALRPPTATIAAYVGFLDGVFAANRAATLPGVTGKGAAFGSLSARERAIAALSITLYGAFQASPERRAARGV
jgi:outer membrane biosynthesis protein TonB